MLQDVIYYQDLYSKYGIISHPVNGEKDLPLVIFLNAGLINRQGPNRIYVKMSHELTRIGFTCFRFDLPGIGDNVNYSKVSTKSQMYIQELKTVIDYFQTTTKFSSFILFGLCTGADLSYDFALEHKLISGMCMVNGTRMPSAHYDYNIDKRYYKKYLTDARRWSKFVSYKKLLKIPRYSLMAMRFVLQKMRLWTSVRSKVQEEGVACTNTEAVDNWRRLLNSDLEILQIIAEGSESFDGRNNVDQTVAKFNASRENYREHIIYDADHTFTSITSQEDLISKVSKWCKSRFIEKMKQ